MQNSSEAREELIKEVRSLRCRVAELERVDTRSKEIEQALHNGLAQLFAIFKNAPILMFLVDSQMRVQKANNTTLQFAERQSTEIVGFKAGEALRCLHSLDDPKGCGFGSFCGNCMLRRVVMRTFEASRGYCRIETQMPFVRQDQQKQLDLLVSTVPVRISGKDMVVLCLEDITEQKKARAEISNWINQLEILNSIVVALGEPLELKQVLDTALERTQALLKADGGVIYLFDEASQTFRSSVHRGISQEVIKEVTGFKIGQGPSGKIAQSGKPLVLPDLATDPRSISPASAKEGWHSYAGMPIKAKGKVSAVLVLVSHQKDYFKVKQIEMLQDIGSHIGIAIEHARLYEGLQQELAEHKKMEEMLQSSEKQWENTFNAISDWVTIVELNGKILRTNRIGEDFTGIPLAELEGQSICRLVHGLDKHIPGCPLQQMIDTRKGATVELRVPDSDRWLMVIVDPITDAEGNLISAVHITRDITERKRAEQTLRESEERFRMVLESSVDNLYRRNLKTNTYDYMSPAVERLSGYSIEEILSMPLEAVVSMMHPDDIDRVKRVLEESMTSDRGTYLLEYRFRHKDGQYRWLSDLFTVVRDAQGHPLYLVGNVRDITERKKAEEELRESEERFRSIFESANDVIVFVNKTGKIIELNGRVKDILGYDRDEIMGKNFIKFGILSIKSTPLITKLFREAVKKGGLLTVRDGRNITEVWLNHKDGHSVLVEASTTAIKKDGKLKGFLSILRDITERKQVEQELIRLSNAIKMSTDGIVISDLDAKMTYVNEATLRMYGTKDKSDLIGKNSFDFIAAGDKEKAYAGMKEVMEKGYISNQEYHIVVKDGRKIPVEMSTALMKDANDKPIGFVGIIRDITERKKAEKKLKQYQFIVESAHDAIFFKDLQSRYIIANDKALEAFGLSRQQIIGKNDYEVSANGAEAKKNIEDDKIVFKTGKPVELTKQMTDINGKERWFQAIKVPQFDDKGKIVGLVGIARDITERKQAEEALHESQERYQAIFEQAADSIVLVDAEMSSLVEFNDKTHKALGYTREEFEKLKIADFEVFETANQVAKHIETVIKKGSDIFETKHRTKDGKIRDIQVSAKAISVRGKNFIQGIWRDVTEHKQAEQALRESEQSYKALADSITDVFFAMDKDLKYTYWNKASEKLTGIESKDAIGKSIFEVFPDDESTRRAAALYRNVLNTQQSTTFITDYKVRGKDLVFEICAYPTIEGISVFVKDITERRKMEQMLRYEKEWSDTIVKSAPNIVIGLGEKSKILLFNEFAEKLTGYKAEEVLGKRWIETFIPERIRKQMYDVWEEIVSTKAVRHCYENPIVMKNGEERIFAWSNTVLLEDGNFRMLLSIGEDITERKQAERKLLEDQAKLKSLASQLTLAEELERRRIAEELHDQVSQSLAISKIKLDSLRASASSQEDVRVLDEVQNSLEQTIDNIRSLTFDLRFPVLYESGLEAAVSEWLADYIQKKHSIVTEFEDDGQLKPLDNDVRILLFRDIRELLFNVIKHARANKVKVSIRKVSSQIHISVEDDGVGFDPAKVAAMAAKKAEFGLFSIRERLEELGGHLEIKSSPNHGCNVIMTSPLKRNKNTKEGKK